MPNENNILVKMKLLKFDTDDPFFWGDVIKNADVEGNYDKNDEAGEAKTINYKLGQSFVFSNCCVLDKITVNGWIIQKYLKYNCNLESCGKYSSPWR